MRRWLVALGISIALVVGASCATKTELSGVWKADSAAVRPMDRILVIGIAADDVKRRTFEDAFVAALQQQGADPVPSYRLLPSPDELSKESIQQAVHGREFQGVITSRLVRVDEQQEYVPPKTYVSPSYYGRGLYGYYGRSYEVVHQPGYTVNTTIVRLETHLYDAASAELLWAAHSGTYNPKSLDDGIASVTKKLSQQLAADGFTPRK